MADFNPADFGATPAASPAAPAATSSFDPTAFGAKPAQSPAAAPTQASPSSGGFLGTTKSLLDSAGDALANALIVNPVKSIAAAATGPGRDITSLMTAGADHPVAGASGDLAHMTNLLIQKARTLPDGDPRKDQLLQNVQDNMKAMGIAHDTLNNLDSVQRTPEQAAGEGVSALGNSMVLLNPASVASKMLLSTGIGALTSAGSAMENKADAGTVLKSGAIGAGAGLAVQGAASGAGAVAKWATSNLPQRLMRAVTGQSSKEILAGKDISKYMLDNAKVGTRESLIKDSSSNVESLGSQIAAKLNAASAKGGTVSNSQVAKMVAQKFNDAGASITPDDVLQMVSKAAPQVRGLLTAGTNDVSNANLLRQGLDLTLGDKGFLTSQVPFSKAVLREFANTLRTGVKAQAPPEVRGMFDELSKEINLRDALLEQGAKTDRGSVVKFGDLVAGVIGAPLGGVPGMAAGVAIERGVRSTPFLTGSAVGLDRVGKALPYLSKLSPALRLFVANAAPQLSGATTPQSSQ